MAWTWVRRDDGYALVPEDNQGARPTAVLVRRGRKWLLASERGIQALPSRPTFDHAERILAEQGVMSAKPPAAPSPEKRKPTPKKPSPPKAEKAKPEPKKAIEPAKPKAFVERQRLKRGTPQIVMGDPATTLRQSREEALKLAGQRGVAEMRAKLATAQQQLEQRLAQTIARGAGEESFTAAQLQQALAQVRAVVADLQPGVQQVVLTNGELASSAAAEDALRYMKQASHRFRGVAQPLAFPQARVLDRAISGTESSLLNRMQGDDKAGPGILTRYGDSVIRSFEDILQQRFIQQKPWADVRNEIVEASPFLQGAPASWAERIVRSEVMAAHNMANTNVIQAVNEETGDGMLKILCATFDGRTGADSYALHGQIRRASEPFQDWTHQYAHPPNRPNDREVVVAHFIEWPIPPELQWKTDAEVAARWAAQKRKGSPPPRPPMTTVPLDQIGKPRAKQSPSGSSEVGTTE